MIFISKVTKIGGSLFVSIPPIIIQELGLLPRELVIIKYNNGKMDITAFKEIMDKINNNNKGNKDDE